jgi:hypothetical protein
MLVTRPFRCDDCVSRFFSWLWRSAAISGPQTDLNSLVYKSPTAALHSSVYRSRRKSRRAAKLLPQRSSIAGFVNSWLKKPIQQPSQQRVAAPAVAAQMFTPRVMADPRPNSLPEILGVILEIKHQPG